VSTPCSIHSPKITRLLCRTALKPACEGRVVVVVCAVERDDALVEGAVVVATVDPVVLPVDETELVGLVIVVVLLDPADAPVPSPHESWTFSASFSVWRQRKNAACVEARASWPGTWMRFTAHQT
jgi:hypothetical protein